VVVAGIVAGFLWLITSFPDCSAGSKQARMARALSAARLQELHQAMIDLRASLPEDERDYRTEFWGDEIPAPFKGLDCALVRCDGDTTLIRLEGCMDHHLDMRFYGVGEPVEPGDVPRITLVSGEFDRKEELLWHQPEPASGQAGRSDGNPPSN
jgi:hypothetical protein